MPDHEASKNSLRNEVCMMLSKDTVQRLGRASGSVMSNMLTGAPAISGAALNTSMVKDIGFVLIDVSCSRTYRQLC